VSDVARQVGPYTIRRRYALPSGAGVVFGQHTGHGAPRVRGYAVELNGRPVFSAHRLRDAVAWAERRKGGPS